MERLIRYKRRTLREGDRWDFQYPKESMSLANDPDHEVYELIYWTSEHRALVRTEVIEAALVDEIRKKLLPKKCSVKKGIKLYIFERKLVGGAYTTSIKGKRMLALKATAGP